MNCAPGDLALIVRSDFVENLGRVVTVVRRAVSGEALLKTPTYLIITAPDDDWIVAAPDLVLGSCHDFAARHLTDTSAYPDSQLLPLRPLDEPIEEGINDHYPMEDI